MKSLKKNTKIVSFSEIVEILKKKEKLYAKTTLGKIKVKTKKGDNNGKGRKQK